MAAQKPKMSTEQVNFRLSQELRMWLGAATGVLGLKHWQIVTEALQQYRARLPADTNRIINEAMRVRRKS